MKRRGESHGEGKEKRETEESRKEKVARHMGRRIDKRGTRHS